MISVAARPTSCNSSFLAVVEPFLQADGLPFVDVLSAESIEEVCQRVVVETLMACAWPR